jgi:hypothetical protein
MTVLAAAPESDNTKMLAKARFQRRLKLDNAVSLGFDSPADPRRPVAVRPRFATDLPFFDP